MRRLWSWKAWNLPPWGPGVLVVTAALSGGATAYADLSAWATGLLVGVAVAVVGVLLETWQRVRRPDAEPPAT